MIRTEKHDTARILCDGCDATTMLYPSLTDALTAMPAIGWRDLGKGMVRLGMPFRHLCDSCFKIWKAGLT